MNNGRQAAYDRGFDDGVESAEKEQECRQRKGKGRATSPECERGELKTKIAQLERKKAKLTGENKRLLRHVDDLLQEAAELRAATLLLQREPPIPYSEMTELHGQHQSIMSDPILLYAEPYGQRTTSNELVTPTSATSSSTGSAKRKAQELLLEDPQNRVRRAKVPKPRILIWNAKTSLPLQFDMAGNQYLPEGTWMRMMKEVPGKGVYQKLDYLASRQWLPIWVDVLKEVKHLEATDGSLGNAQKKIRVINRAPLSVLELAMTNRASTPAGVRCRVSQLATLRS
jgi:hypothetical protein